MNEQTPNPIPQVGQLLYNEHVKADGELQFASLVFVDEPIEEGKQWMYSQIAHMEDFGEGMVIYGGFEAGGMPAQYTRLATDDDLRTFITMMKEGKIPEDGDNLETWLENVQADEDILDTEKARIKQVAESL